MKLHVCEIFTGFKKIYENCYSLVIGKVRLLLGGGGGLEPERGGSLVKFAS